MLLDELLEELEGLREPEELEEDLELRKPIDVFQENLQEGLGGYLIEEEVDDWVVPSSGERGVSWKTGKPARPARPARLPQISLSLPLPRRRSRS
jgi:hypothetical protein